jgi:hypothetical protein
MKATVAALSLAITHPVRPVFPVVFFFLKAIIKTGFTSE